MPVYGWPVRVSLNQVSLLAVSSTRLAESQVTASGGSYGRGGTASSTLTYGVTPFETPLTEQEKFGAAGEVP
jgi:hypothetical protein